MSAYRDWWTLREIDTAAGTVKGTAFRRFRGLEAQLQAERDYRVLHHRDDREAIAALRTEQRIHMGSVNVVLISAAVAARILGDLHAAQ